jgi:hypothetical protein
MIVAGTSFASNYVGKVCLALSKPVSTETFCWRLRQPDRPAGIAEGSSVTDVEFGDGRLSQVAQNRVDALWLGESRRITILIADTWMPRADDPLSLVGTGLLSPHLLLIDCGHRLVEIETQ